MRSLSTTAATLVALGSLAWAADEPKVQATSYRIGETVADVTAKDVDGGEWKLSALRAVTAESALDAVRKAAAEYGGKPDAKAEDALDALAGLKGDAALKLEFARKAGKAFGLFPKDEVVAAWKTYGDVATWVAGAAKAPVVLMWWSPKCPTSARYEERIVEILQETGARIYPVATNQADDDASIQGYLKAKGLSYRVVIDRDAVLADRFGAKRTPHVFVLDESNALRYSGAVDNDKDEGRSDWLLAALKAVGDGSPLEVLMTEPKG